MDGRLGKHCMMQPPSALDVKPQTHEKRCREVDRGYDCAMAPQGCETRGGASDES